MRKIYLIRHCAPAFPGGQKMCIASTDLPLGEEGFAHGARLELPRSTALFSSPLQRCTQTAQAMGLPFQVLEGLRERGVGQWEGLTFSQIKEQYPRLYAARGADPSLSPPGAEDREGALARFREALREAARRAPGDFAVITHGGILELFLEKTQGRRYKPRYGEIVTLSWDDAQVPVL